MIPFLGDSGKRRNINLGGSTASTHASIIDQAKARRQERERVRKRDEAAVKLQSWFRGRSEARRAQEQLQRHFDVGLSLIDATRYIALFGRDDEYRMAIWSSQMLQVDSAIWQAPLEQSWQTLLPQVSLVILNAIAQHPESPSAVVYLRLLNTFLSSSTPAPSSHLTISHRIMDYLLPRGFYERIRDAILIVPLERKTTESLPLLITLCSKALSLFPPDTTPWALNFTTFVQTILSIPQLANRLPLLSVSHLSSHIPFSRLERLDISLVARLSLEERAHLIANLSTFATPRYSRLSATSLEAYLTLLTALLEGLPVGSLELEKSDGGWLGNSEEVDSDSDEPIAKIVSHFAPPPPTLVLDSRTTTRIRSLQTAIHLQPILAASVRHPSTRFSLFSFVLCMCGVWPTKRDNILGVVATHGGSGLVREVYRGWVRPSPLGRQDSVQALEDPMHISQWPPLLFMAELYSHLLLTMGDDEFFASSNLTARNPLSLDEVISFSKQLLHVAFPLYWHDQQTSQRRCLPNLPITWEGIRDRCTKCLQALHARDSRRPFTPGGHWLWTHEFDIKSFIGAAIAEEKELEVGTRLISKRQLAYISPRLGILNNIPFSIPFDVRVAIFRNFVYNDQRRLGLDDYYRTDRAQVEIRRGKIAQDGFDHLQDLDLKRDVKITFIDQFGNEEMGIDGGGVFKEFLTSLVKEVFDSDRGLWLENEQRELYPNPHTYATEPHSLNWYRFIGRILGKALYEGILVDVAFAGFFLAKWLGKQSFLDDLRSLDQDLYKGLLHLKHEPHPESLALDFTVTQDDLGVTKTISLVSGGGNIPVTSHNRLQYIYLVSHYHLSRKIKLQSEAFFEGLATMVDPKWLRMFNQQEMQLLISGANSPIDVDDLKSNTQYGGVFDEEEGTIRLFWKVVQSFDQEQRRALLRFTTSCSRPPLLGFKELNPKFCIRDSSNDETRLPTASTCVNLLKLPRYKSETIMREKILQAIFSGAGFDLS